MAGTCYLGDCSEPQETGSRYCHKHTLLARRIIADEPTPEFLLKEATDYWGGDKVNGKTFDVFMSGARDLVEGKAVSKGYNDGGTEKNDLMEFTNKFFPGHAGGEIVYKAIRYKRKKDKSDLLKIAAWAYLLWRYDGE